MRFFALALLTLVLSAILTHPAYSQSKASCGDILEGEIGVQEADAGHFYAFEAGAGDTVTIIGSPIGQTALVRLRIYDPGSNRLLDTWDRTGVDLTISNFVMPASGSYQLQITDYHSRPMAYGMAIACTLRDGTNIPAGQPSLPQPPVEPIISGLTAFSGFGFPGLQPCDFSAGIEIPLTAGQPQVAPIGGDVALYTYQGTAGQTATLTVSRISGNISIGVAVINRDTNEIIFIGGMPHSSTLASGLTFPTDGTYAIGLFRLDTPTLTGSSGAVQISIQ